MPVYDRVCVYTPLVPANMTCYDKANGNNQAIYRLQNGPITMVDVLYSAKDKCINGEHTTVIHRNPPCVLIPPRPAQRHTHQHA